MRKKKIAWNKGLTKETAPQLSHSGVKKGNIPWNKGVSYKPLNHFTPFKKGYPSWNKGLKMSEEFKRKCRKRQIGKKHSEETKQKMSISNTGKKKGGWKLSKKTRMKMSLSRQGRHFSQETIKKIREGNLGKVPWNRGKKTSEEHRKKISISQSGEKAHNWKGGASFAPYPSQFNNALKRKIRERDNHTCQECGYTEDKLGYKLSIHHIDYDKTNNSENNLISLCRSCHSQTGYNREDWTNYFKQKANA